MNLRSVADTSWHEDLLSCRREETIELINTKIIFGSDDVLVKGPTSRCPDCSCCSGAAYRGSLSWRAGSPSNSLRIAQFPLTYPAPYDSPPNWTFTAL